MFDMKPQVHPSYRQGDVLLMPCPEIPADAFEGAPENGRAVLARGEVTGHAHTMGADRVRHFRQDRFGGETAYVHVTGLSPVELRHEEHGPLMIPPGSYRVIQQREYQPRSLPRAVVD